MVLMTIAALTLLTAIILQWVTPLYESKALLRIENRERNVANFDSVITGLSADAETIESEIQVIRSRTLAKNAITALELHKDPNFNTALAQNKQSQENDWSTVLTDFFGGLKQSGEGMSDKEYQQHREWSELVDLFLDNLDVQQIEKSHVLAITYTTKNPMLATHVTNKIVDLYIGQQLKTKFEATRRATAWLNQRVSELQKAVEQSDTAVESFRRDSGLLQGKEGDLTAQQISEINSQLILAKARQTESLVRLRQINNQSDRRSAIESTTEILQSELIQRLRAQESDLQRGIAELSMEYGKRHPKMINMLASLKGLQKKIDLEERKIVRGLKNEVAIANSSVWSLQSSLDELKKEVAIANEDEVKLNALEREAEANRLLLTTFLSRFKEMSSQQDPDVHKPDVTIISTANIPVKPSFPKKIPILALSIVASGFVGLLLVFFVEHMGSGFRSGEQIEDLTGIPSLGFVPLLSGLAKQYRAPASYLIKHPKSALSQAINTLVWSIQLAHKQVPPKTILITSTQAKEGKTTIAACLAKKYALSGKKVIIVDTDFYLPSVANVFNKTNESGLIDVLSEKQTLEDVITKDDETGVDILVNGRSESSMSDILASEHVDRLLEILADQYDIVILDTCPVLVASDALILSQKVDTTLFVVRWAETKQKAVQLSLKKLINAGSNVTGVVLSMVDVKKYSLYDYGDSGSYGGQSENYYYSTPSRDDQTT